MLLTSDESTSACSSHTTLGGVYVIEIWSDVLIAVWLSLVCLVPSCRKHKTCKTTTTIRISLSEQLRKLDCSCELVGSINWYRKVPINLLSFEKCFNSNFCLLLIAKINQLKLIIVAQVNCFVNLTLFITATRRPFLHKYYSI